MYTIKKTNCKIDSINSPEWEKAQTAEVNINNWSHKFPYLPNTYANLLYNDDAIFVKMWTDENPILARCTEPNGRVCKDSCMEFFFSPKEGDKRYINFEFNPFGTMYLAVRSSRYDPVYPEYDKHCFNVQTSVEKDKWTLFFTVPFSFIDEIFGGHTKVMLGNLYKCGEDTEKEHYGSFYPLHPTEIDFHRSEFFGEFVLE